MPASSDIEAFEAARPRLLGLAYRILGSRADAEDAVQDTFLLWQREARAGVGNPVAWLTTACTRRCLDLLRSAHRTRVDYIGAWLPEPVHTRVDETAGGEAELASTLTTAFLLMLERLTAKERAAYLLHEIFDVSYPEVAEALGLQEAACRKLVSRAKANVDHAKVRHVTPMDDQDRLLTAFNAAIVTGEPTALAELLSQDIRLSADGGGKVPTVLDVIEGEAKVLEFLTDRLHEYWASYEWAAADINGGRGFILRDGATTAAAVTFAYDDLGMATDIFVVRNPDKLSRLRGSPLH